MRSIHAYCSYAKAVILNKLEIAKDDIRYSKKTQKREMLFQFCHEKKIIIFSNDCVGGRVMKDYGLPCYSPMVNAWYSAEDYIKICEKPLYYFQFALEDCGLDEDNHPLGRLGDVYLHFTHFSNFESAKRRWNRGVKQFYQAYEDNHEFLIIMNDRNFFTDRLVERFENLPYQYKVLFTHVDHRTPNTFYMKNEDSREFVDIMTNFENLFSCKRRYERFDFFGILLKMYHT